MKKWAASGVLVVAAVALAWALWPTEELVAPPGGGRSDLGLGQSRADPRPLAALLAGAHGPLAMPDAGVSRLLGTVLDEGGEVVAFAEVEVLPASNAPTIIGASCEACGAQLLACESFEVAAQVARAVRAGEGAPMPIAAARSGADGTFEVPVQWEGEVVVRAQDGRGRAAWQLVECDGADQEVELELLAPRQVAGVVLGEAGEPVPGARVLLVSTSDGRHVEAVAGGNGEFAARCPAEPCSVWSYVEAPGFAPAVANLGLVETDEEPLALQLSKSRALEVQTRLAGQPIDAEVVVTIDAHAHRLLAAGGAARLEGLGAYDVTVEAEARGFTSGQRPVSLAQASTVVKIELRASSRALVEVLNDKGEPEPDATVSLDGPDARADAQTDEHGSLVVLGPVGEGAYQLSVQGAGGAQARREVDLLPGDNNLQVTLPAVLHLRGKVVGLDPEAEGGDSIQLTAATGDEVARDNVGPDGAFDLKVTSSGPWELSAESAVLGRARATATAPADGVVLQLDRRAGLQVKVTALGQPAPDVLVVIEPEGALVGGRRARKILMLQHEPRRRGHPRSMTGVTDEGGLVQVWGFEPGPVTVRVADAAFRPAHRQVELVLGRQTQVELNLERGAEIDGLVVDAQGAPVPGADVSVRPAPRPNGEDSEEALAAHAYYPRAVEERGRFTISGLEPGQRYVLAAATEGALSEEVTVQAPARGVRLALAALPRISGRVIDRAGAPVPQFDVDGTSFEAPDGRFEVVSASPERVQTIYVMATGFQSRAVDVARGASAGDVVLLPAARLEGQVLSARGEPVPGAQVMCEVCTDSTTGADGRFTLEVEEADFPFTVRAARGAASGVAEATGAGPLLVRLGPKTLVVGQSNDLEGRPVPGRVVATMVGGGGAPEVFTADAQGRFGGELAQGDWDFFHERGERGRQLRVEGARFRVTLGTEPGTCSLSVALPDAQRWNVYVLEGRGEPPPEERSPVALLEGPGEGEAHATHLACGQATLLARAGSAQVARYALELKAGLTRFSLPAAAPAPAQAQAQAQSGQGGVPEPGSAAP